MQPGIYFGLPEQEYFAARALSCSGMKQLAVSPLNYWHHNLNPAFVRPEETYPQRFGKAIHNRLLEPLAHAQRYTKALSIEDRPGALVTMDDMKEWLAENNLPVTAKRKQDLVDRIEASGMEAVIWDKELAEFIDENEGKVLLDSAESVAIDRLAAVVAADPFATAALSGGVPEVSFFVRDTETGVLLKARMDYVKPQATIDLKTFSNSRGKPIDRVVFDAIHYEGYNLQCVAYQHVRELARQQLVAGEIATHGNVSEAWLDGFLACDKPAFGFVFVESSEPFDLRIVELRHSEAVGAGANVYWSAAEMKRQDMTHLYAACLAKYGEEQWREPRPPYVLTDIDIPQLMFA